MTWILGLNLPPTGWHDTAACLVDETGRVYAMSEEERFSRKKHGIDQQPSGAVAFCLAAAGITAEQVDAVAVGWDAPRLYEQYSMNWHYGNPRALLDGVGLGGTRRQPDVVFVPHHRAHAVSALYAAGLDDAAVLVVDGNGEDEATSLFEARAGRPLVRRRRWPRAESLGHMYAAVSEALGFGIFGAGKTMGLASYGRVRDPEPWPLLDADLKPPFAYTEDDSYEQVMADWRKYVAGLLGSERIAADPDRLDESPEAVRLAWSAQVVVERAMLDLVAQARAETGLDAVCIAGGVALNCSANGMLPQPVYVPPIPHDAGVALGAAWSLTRRPEGTLSPYLGSELTVDQALRAEFTGPADPARVTELLLAGKVGAVAAGRAEIGPRALGHRSIIALPSSTAVRDRINRDKGREPWRPLAPMARVDQADGFWRVLPTLQRYMLGATEVTAAAHEAIPGAVHVDATARAQVASEEVGLCHEVLGRLAEAGAPPVIINTSLNRRGEPLVDSAEQAVAAFETIGLDFLVLDDGLIER